MNTNGHRALLKACNVKEVRDQDRLVTLPNGEVIYFNGGSHRYERLTEDGREPLTPVSTILRVLDKPALLSWVRRVTLEGHNFWEVRDEAGERGVSIHTALEKLAAGIMPNLLDFPESDRGYVQGLAAWWIAARPQVIATEVIVASLTYGFAGRFDLLALIGGKLTLAELKTTKKVYPMEHFCQVEGYEGAAVECGYQRTEQRIVVRVGEDGTFEVAQSCAEYVDFLDVLDAYHAQRRVQRRWAEQVAHA